MSDSVLLHVFGNVTKTWQISFTDVDITTVLKIASHLSHCFCQATWEPFVGFLRKETISHKSKVHTTWSNREEFIIEFLVIYLHSPVIVLLI